MHDLIFVNQRQIKRENLISDAEELHLDLQKFTTTMDSAEIRNRLEEDRREGMALGITGTPTFFINGKRYTGALPIEQFRAIINNELSALGVPPPSTGGAQLTTQEQPGIAFGAPDSPVTLTWFSDLQSSLSPDATKLVHDLMEAHPGKIRLVFKNRPLDIHRDAILQHEAAMAAHAQGKFWEMHELILANQQKTARADLLGFAARIGLDVQRAISIQGNTAPQSWRTCAKLRPGLSLDHRFFS
jgi:protein-disulfide isomerase